MMNPWRVFVADEEFDKEGNMTSIKWEENPDLDHLRDLESYTSKLKGSGTYEWAYNKLMDNYGSVDAKQMKQDRSTMSMGDASWNPLVDNMKTARALSGEVSWNPNSQPVIQGEGGDQPNMSLISSEDQKKLEAYANQLGVTLDSTPSGMSVARVEVAGREFVGSGAAPAQVDASGRVTTGGAARQHAAILDQVVKGPGDASSARTRSVSYELTVGKGAHVKDIQTAHQLVAIAIQNQQTVKALTDRLKAINEQLPDTVQVNNNVIQIVQQELVDKDGDNTVDEIRSKSHEAYDFNGDNIVNENEGSVPIEHYDPNNHKLLRDTLQTSE
jgi:hypothetical protein